jgi:hypothetical protein
MRRAGQPASQTAGTAKLSNLPALLASAGSVFPRAWNIPEQMKISPDATKLNEITRRKPTATEGRST